MCEDGYSRRAYRTNGEGATLTRVSLGTRLVRILRGTPTSGDPDEFVELLTVSSGSAPLLLRGLATLDIDAQGQPTYNVVTRTLADNRVLVRRRDMAAALAALEKFGFSDT